VPGAGSEVASEAFIISHLPSGSHLLDRRAEGRGRIGADREGIEGAFPVGLFWAGSVLAVRPAAIRGH